jgi:hypothetical protein
VFRLYYYMFRLYYYSTSFHPLPSCFSSPHGVVAQVTALKHLKQVKPYPASTVFRGVKADLRADYPEGREITWHGFW